MFEVLSYAEELERASRKLGIPPETLDKLHAEVYEDVDVENADHNAMQWEFEGRTFYVYVNPSTVLIPPRAEFLARLDGLEFYTWPD